MIMKDKNDNTYTAIERKVPQQREEAKFEKNLATAASYLKCCYIKIPDPIYGSRRVRAMKAGQNFIERRRPFDGLLIVPKDDEHYGGTYCIEAKFGYNKLAPHQFNSLSIVNNINGMAYLVRARNLKRGTVYTVEWPEKEVLFETEDLVEFITWFKELSRIPK